MALFYETGIRNMIGGSGEPLSHTLDTRSRTTHYKVYAASIAGATAYDPFTDLGVYATKGFIKNLDTSISFTLAFSIDGTNYGDNFTLLAGETIDLNLFIAFKKFKLTPASGSPSFKAIVI